MYSVSTELVFASTATNAWREVIKRVRKVLYHYLKVQRNIRDKLLWQLIGPILKKMVKEKLKINNIGKILIILIRNRDEVDIIGIDAYYDDVADLKNPTYQSKF